MEQELRKIEESDASLVWEKMKNTKVTKSVLPGEIPGKLYKEFSPELAIPVAKIYSNILKSGKWPQKWKVEFGVPIAKTPNPQNEDDLRVLSLTPWMSKVLEKFVLEWLMDYVGDKIDLKQFGGTKGVATTHYLIELINFINYNLECRKHDKKGIH